MNAAVDDWFAICEVQFELRHITGEATRFYHVLSAKPPEIIASLPSAIIASKKYTELKEAIMVRHERTKPEMFAKLMAKTQPTGRPSAYIHELMATANRVGVGNELVRHQFNQALPPRNNAGDNNSKKSPLIELGTLADEIQPFLKPCMVQGATTPEARRYSRPTVSTGATPERPITPD